MEFRRRPRWKSHTSSSPTTRSSTARWLSASSRRACRTERRFRIRTGDSSRSSRPISEERKVQAMEINLLEMWHTMNPIVKSAVVVLTIQGIWGITVTVDRLLMLFMSKRRSRKFAADVADADGARRCERGDADRRRRQEAKPPGALHLRRDQGLSGQPGARQQPEPRRRVHAAQPRAHRREPQHQSEQRA